MLADTRQLSLEPVGKWTRQAPAADNDFIAWNTENIQQPTWQIGSQTPSTAQHVQQ